MASAALVVDRSVVALRRAGAPVIGRALAAGSLVGWVVLLAYYLEEVEGVRTLRPLLGALLALAFWGRAFLLANVARVLVAPLLPPDTPLPAIRFVDVARTASVVGVGLFFWLWLPILGSYVAEAAAAAMLLPLCIRGAVAPTWIARAGVESEGGVGAFRRALRDLGSDRGKGVLVELFLLLGGAAIFVNLLAAAAAMSLLGRSFLGVDVADLETFFSSSNTFVLLSLAVVSATALEPLRAGVSAVLYVEARARREGFDLEAAVRGVSRRGGAVAAIALAVSFAVANVATAQASAEGMPAEAVAPEYGRSLTERDRVVQERIEEALSRSEFDEHGGVARGRTLRELVDRFFDWLVEEADVAFEPSDSPPLAMPPGWVFGALFATLTAVVLFVALRARAEARVRAPAEAEPARLEIDPRDRPPEAHLDEAARLAAAGAYREAFRALYLATLVALDRRGAIAFDRSRTNWHYLRSMAGGPTRETFHRFTALFDRKWYGDESTSEGDYRLGRELADRLCAAAHEQRASTEP